MGKQSVAAVVVVTATSLREAPSSLARRCACSCGNSLMKRVLTVGHGSFSRAASSMTNSEANFRSANSGCRDIGFYKRKKRDPLSVVERFRNSAPRKELILKSEYVIRHRPADAWTHHKSDHKTIRHRCDVLTESLRRLGNNTAISSCGTFANEITLRHGKIKVTWSPA